MTMPLSYLESSAVGGWVVTLLPIPLICVVYLCWGEPHGEDFCHAGFAVGILPPQPRLSLRVWESSQWAQPRI